MTATPLHAYVPGKTSRHPDGAFDSLRASVRPGMSAADLADSAAFAAGLMFFEEGFFWEAHEVLEPVWMALPKGSDDRHAVEAVIQIANARLKLRMERPKAVLRLCDMAEALVTQSKDGAMGLARDQLRDWILATRQMVGHLPD